MNILLICYAIILASIGLYLLVKFYKIVKNMDKDEDKISSNIEHLNTYMGGDWFYIRTSDSYRDSMTDRTINNFPD